MIKVLLNGCNGKMGQVISRLIQDMDGIEISAGVDLFDGIKNTYPVSSDLNNVNESVDVVIDFSNPKGINNLIAFTTARSIPLVVATTGLTEENISNLKEASQHIPIFFSANMSLGINLLIDLVKKAAKILETNFDIEIIEKHHNQKLDAPSGTALKIADAINDTLEQKKEYIYDRHSRRKKRSKKEIGIHAVRGGTIVGEHSVIFAGNDEIIEINHMAMSKDVFGIGALRAAKFIYGKQPGMYDMNDLISEE